MPHEAEIPKTKLRKYRLYHNECAYEQ